MSRKKDYLKQYVLFYLIFVSRVGVEKQTSTSAKELHINPGV
jgi:hypothetical protein